MCIVASLHTFNVSSAATCQLSCQLSCNGKLSCQLRCNLSAQLHSVGCVDPLPSLNSILPPKMRVVFLVATNQSRVHAVTVHCIHSMTHTLPKQPHVYPARAMPRHHGFARCISHPLMMSRNVHFSSMQGWEVAITKPQAQLQ